jgi:hypothetical protein
MVSGCCGSGLGPHWPTLHAILLRAVQESFPCTAIPDRLELTHEQNPAIAL